VDAQLDAAGGLLSSHEIGLIWQRRDHVAHVMFVFVPRVHHALIGPERDECMRISRWLTGSC
jgi:hypothetical protein